MGGPSSSVDPEAASGSVEMKSLASQQPSSSASTRETEMSRDRGSIPFIKVLCSPCTDLVRKDRYELAESFKDTMISSLPPQGSVDSDDLERTGYALHIAVAFQATFLFFLLFIGVSDYEYNKKAEFLSPSPSEGNCETVPATVRNGYYADKYGHWDREPEFQPSTSMYSAFFSGAEVTMPDYMSSMKDFQVALKDIAHRAAQRDLAYTMTAMSMFYSYSQSNIMGMKYDVAPEILFDFMTAEYGISDVTGNCIPFGDTPVAADFDPVSKRFIFRTKVHNGTDGVNPCPQFETKDFIYNKYSYDAEGMTDIAFDVRSALTAIAVNRGILRIKDLRPITSYQYNDTVYINEAYSDMAPIYCIPGSNGTDADQCFLFSGNYYPIYPTMVQYGSADGSLPCSCPYNASQFPQDECDVNNLLVSFLYLRISDNYSTVFDFAAMLSKYRIADPEYGDVNASEVVRKAHITSLPISSLASRKAAYKEMCGGYNCTLFHIQLIGELAFNSVNLVGTQLAEYYADNDPGACKYALYNDAAFSPLIEKTPTDLEESYYVCKTPKTTAFQRAVGVAAGSATLYSSIVLSVMVFLLVRGFNMRNRSDPIVEPDEKRRRAETRMSMMEINATEHDKKLKEVMAHCSQLAEANARLNRQVEDLTKSLIQVRNDMIGVKVDIARG